MAPRAQPPAACYAPGAFVSAFHQALSVAFGFRAGVAGRRALAKRLPQQSQAAGRAAAAPCRRKPISRFVQAPDDVAPLAAAGPWRAAARAGVALFMGHS